MTKRRTGGRSGRSGRSIARGRYPRLVPPPPSIPEAPVVSLIFASDWSTATGSTLNAVGDGGKWGASKDLANADLVVQSASGLDFPTDMTNVLMVRALDTVASRISNPLGVSALAQGSSRHWRMYYRQGIDDAATGGNMHQPQMANVGGATPFWYDCIPAAGATFTFRASDRQTTPTIHTWSKTLNNLQTYRLEWRLQRFVSDRGRLDIRIYNSSDTLLFDSSDWSCTYHGGGEVLSDAPNEVGGDGANLNWDTTDWSFTAQWGFYAPGSADIYVSGKGNYYGGFAISDTDWVGPYQAGETA